MTAAAEEEEEKEEEALSLPSLSFFEDDEGHKGSRDYESEEGEEGREEGEGKEAWNGERQSAHRDKAESDPFPDQTWSTIQNESPSLSQSGSRSVCVGRLW